MPTAAPERPASSTAHGCGAWGHRPGGAAAPSKHSPLAENLQSSSLLRATEHGVTLPRCTASPATRHRPPHGIAPPWCRAAQHRSTTAQGSEATSRSPAPGWGAGCSEAPDRWPCVPYLA